MITHSEILVKSTSTKVYYTPTREGQCWAYLLDPQNYFRPVIIGKIDKCGEMDYTGRVFKEERVTIHTSRRIFKGSSRAAVAEDMVRYWFER